MITASDLRDLADALDERDHSFTVWIGNYGPAEQVNEEFPVSVTAMADADARMRADQLLRHLATYGVPAYIDAHYAYPNNREHIKEPEEEER